MTRLRTAHFSLIEEPQGTTSDIRRYNVTRDITWGHWAPMSKGYVKFYPFFMDQAHKDRDNGERGRILMEKLASLN